MAKKYGNDDWIHKFKIVHGDRYGYSETDCEHKDKNGKVKVICKKHGAFYIRPKNHAFGQGCKECMKENISVIKRSNTNNFIEKANKVHKGFYTYEKSEYINENEKLTITCPIHGDFEQTPHNHLQGHGCPSCKKNKISSANSFDTTNFIKKSKEIHGNKYDYSLAAYKKCYSIVEIICPKHGVFKQTPRDHLQGCGCPMCKSSKLEDKIINLLNENNIEFERNYKFDWLKPQSIDFYLPKYNSAIECQGLQHFKPSNFGSKKKDSNEMLSYIQELDKKKYNLLKEHNIKLLYYSNLGINYPYEVIENQEELLNEIYKR